MAAVIAKVTTKGVSGRMVHEGFRERAASSEVEVQAYTLRTLAKSVVKKDGSATITIERRGTGGDRVELLSVFLNPERDPAIRLSVQFGPGLEPRDFQIRNGQRLELRTHPKLDPVSNEREEAASGRVGPSGMNP